MNIIDITGIKRYLVGEICGVLWNCVLVKLLVIFFFMLTLVIVISYILWVILQNVPLLCNKIKMFTSLFLSSDPLFKIVKRKKKEKEKQKKK